MAITRERKQELVALYRDLLSRTDGLIITEYRRLTVKEVSELRAKLREVNGHYVVTKNRLFQRALQEAGWPPLDDLLEGPVAVAFGDGNFPGVAKTMLAFIKDHPEQVQVKGGILAGAVLDAKQVEAISNLPSLDELRAQLAGLLVQPATGLVSILNAATGQLVNVLHAYVQANSEEAA